MQIDGGKSKLSLLDRYPLTESCRYSSRIADDDALCAITLLVMGLSVEEIARKGRLKSKATVGKLIKWLRRRSKDARFIKEIRQRLVERAKVRQYPLDDVEGRIMRAIQSQDLNRERNPVSDRIREGFRKINEMAGAIDVDPQNKAACDWSAGWHREITRLEKMVLGAVTLPSRRTIRRPISDPIAPEILNRVAGKAAFEAKEALASAGKVAAARLARRLGLKRRVAQRMEIRDGGDRR
ncbi:MAG: hypothetical protein PHV34_08800 [Verrucomicrobiae bacterium]|nr:hypothetical protein [Verrucomicrobiae bacterium]